MRYTLMHISDLHAGRPFQPHLAELVARQAHALRPDLLVISGDFVQRADFPNQWRTVTAYLQTLPQPQLTVPGNHDVPLLNGFARLFFPLHYYRRHISDDLNPVFTRPGLAVVGGCSAHGLTLAGGYVNRQQRTTLEQAFAQFNADTCKVAVIHHPVVVPPGGKRHGQMSNARETVRLLHRCGVELLLCGHIHFSYIDSVPGIDVVPGALAVERRGMVIAQCGTTTSRRGRGVDRNKNSFNIIEIDDQTIRVTPHFYLPSEQQFVPVAERIFERQVIKAHQQGIGAEM